MPLAPIARFGDDRSPLKPSQFCSAAVGCAILAMLTVASNACGQANDWAMHGYDAGNTFCNAQEAELRPPLKLLWRTGMDSVVDSMTVSQGRILASGMGEGNANALSCFDSEKGKLLWSFKLPGGGRGGMRVSPAVLDQKVFVGGQFDDRLYALHLGTGELAWEIEGMHYGFYSNSPKVHRGNLFINANGGPIAMVDPNTGKIRWSSEQTGRQGTLAVNDDLVFVTRIVPKPHPVVALDAGTGETRWTAPLDCASWLTSAGELLFAPAWEKGASTDDQPCNRLVAFRTSDGTIAWNTKLATQLRYANMSLHDGVLFVSSGAPGRASSLYAIDPKTGTVQYQRDDIALGQLASANGFLYVGRSGIYALNATNLQTVWRAPIRRASDFVISGSKLYVSTGRELICFGNYSSAERRAVAVANEHLSLALGYLQSDDLQKAIQECRLSIESKPTASSHFQLAKALRRASNFDQARQEYRNALRLLEAEVGDDPLQRIVAPYGDQFSAAGVYMSLAGVERDAGDREAERSAWEKLVKVLEAKPAPNDPVYWGVLGQGLYRINRVNDCRAAMEQTIALRKEAKPTIERGPRWWYLAMSLAKTGEIERGLEIFRVLVQQSGANPTEIQTRFRDEAAAALELPVAQRTPAPNTRAVAQSATKRAVITPQLEAETWEERLGREKVMVQPNKIELHELQVSALPRDVFGKGKRLDEGRTNDWLIGSGTAVYGSLTMNDTSALEFMDKQSYVERFIDDQGTDLLASPGIKTPSVTFEMNRPLSVKLSKDKRIVGFTIRGYQVPALDAKRVSATAKLFFRSFTDLKTEERSDMRFNFGASFQVGPVSFSVQDPQTVSTRGPRVQRGGPPFDSKAPKSAPALALIVLPRSKPLMSIELLDKDGDVILFDENEAAMRSEGLLTGPRHNGGRLTWMIRKTLTPPAGIRVKWYDKSELIEVPVEFSTFMGLGEAPPIDAPEPASQLVGVVDGKPFRPDSLEFRNHSLTFRRLDSEISFSLFFWRELLKDGVKLRGGVGGTGGPSWIIVKSSGQTDHVRENFKLFLDITRYSNRIVEGTIDLHVDDRDVHLRGPFSVAQAKSPTEPLDESDTPYVIGRARILGRTAASQVGADFIGRGTKGNRLRGFSQSLQHGISAAWTDQNAPQVSSIRKDGDHHVIFQHARLEPGEYLFYLAVGGRELLSSHPVSWVKRTVKDGDEIQLEMDVDLTKLGTVEVNVPDSIVKEFKASYDRQIERKKQQNGNRSSGLLGSMKPVLPVYLNPRELDKSNFITGQNPFRWGNLEPGKSTTILNHVPPGTYIARCGASQAEVTVVAGERVSVKLVDEETTQE